MHHAEYCIATRVQNGHLWWLNFFILYAELVAMQYSESAYIMLLHAVPVQVFLLSDNRKPLGQEQVYEPFVL